MGEPELAAASMVNVTQQVGGAVLAHGMASSFTVAAIFDVCALIVILVAIRVRPARSGGAAADQPDGCGEEQQG